jgi:hypothetical protein
MATARKANTTSRGLGWAHQKQVAELLRRLVDGALCWWCGRPMYRNPLRNWDKRQLQGDHSVARATGGRKTDRLLHATCNEQAGDHTHDHLRPALTGQHMAQVMHADTLDPRLMPWP